MKLSDLKICTQLNLGFGAIVTLLLLVVSVVMQGKGKKGMDQAANLAQVVSVFKLDGIPASSIWQRIFH